MRERATEKYIYIYTYSICGQYCFVLCGLISAAQRNEAEPDSNEEEKFSKPNLNQARRTFFIAIRFGLIPLCCADESTEERKREREKDREKVRGGERERARDSERQRETVRDRERERKKGRIPRGSYINKCSK